jgi:hypothetical protein
LFGVLLLAGCTTEENPPQQTLHHSNPTTTTPGTPAPGQNNNDGEHGTAVPAGPAVAPDPGTSLGSDTWADGKKIDANVTISAGSTITVAPGAVVTIAANVAITVRGTLKAAANAQHGKLTGTGWAGILVAQGGTLDLNSLDIQGAQSAIWTQTGNTGATITNSVINGDTPFKMETGSKLAIVSSKITATASSAIAGTFTASHMDYDKGTAPGLVLNDAAGTMTISDSNLTGKGGPDFVVSDAGKLVKVEYSTISGSHCALHFGSVDQYTIDHVSFDNIDATATNSYAAMLYGSGAGPNTITASNIDGILDLSGTNGPLTITKSFVSPTASLQGTPSPTSAATSRIADAQPRATQ